MKNLKLKRLICMLLAMMLCLSMVACGGEESSKVELSIDDGIGNQTYLYGMCYSIDERDYASNSIYDMKLDVKLMANLGVKSVRIWMHVDSILDTPTTIDEAKVAQTKALINELNKYGMQIIGMSHTSFHDGSYRTGKPDRDISKDSYYTKWLNNYYLSWKTMSAAFPEITYWEIDNEMNNADFMCNLDGDKVYSQDQMAGIATDMLYYASRGIKESNPKAERIMGGLTEPTGLGSGQNKSFLIKVYENIKSNEFGYFYNEEDILNASTNADDYFTSLAWHPYLGSGAFNKENFIKFNNEIYQVVLDYEKKHKKVYFTELGFSDSTYGEETAASYIEQAFTTIAESMPYVEAVHYFKLFNVASVGWTGTVSRFGLFYDPDPNRIDVDKDDLTTRLNPGEAKGKAYTYQKMAGGSGNLDLLKITL